MQGGRKVAKAAQGESAYEMKRYRNNIVYLSKNTADFIGKDPKCGCHIHLHLI